MRGLTLAAGAIMLAGCATASPDISGLVLARVNDEPITVQDLQDSFTSSHQGHGVFLAGQDAIKTFLDKEIDRRLLVQEARRVGIDRKPEIEEVRESLRRRRATEAFYKERVDGRVVVTDAAIAAAHEAMGFRFEARHILVDTRQEAEAARARIARGEAFGDVAQAVSRSATATKGGDLGIVGWGRGDPALESLLWTMKTGDLSQPFETEQGWNLLSVVEHAEVERPKIERVRNLITARLTQREKERLTRAVHQELLARGNAVIRESLVIAAALADDPKKIDAQAVVAEGGGEQVTLAQVLPLIEPGGLRRSSPGRRERGVRRFLETELARRLATSEAVAKGYGDRPEFRREIARATEARTLDRFLDTVVLAKLDVSDVEAEAYWASASKAFTEPQAVKLGAIFVETEAEANAIVAALGDGKDFGALARASKNPGLASSSGDLGWVVEGRLQPGIEKVAFALPEGAVGIARVDTGYVVVRAEKLRAARVRPFAEVREQARDRALRARGQDILKTWIAKLREASAIEVDGEAIARAVAAAEKEARERAARRATPGKHGQHGTDDAGAAGKPGESTVK